MKKKLLLQVLLSLMLVCIFSSTAFAATVSKTAPAVEYAKAKYITADDKATRKAFIVKYKDRKDGKYYKWELKIKNPDGKLVKIKHWDPTNKKWEVLSDAQNIAHFNTPRDADYSKNAIWRFYVRNRTLNGKSYKNVLHFGTNLNHLVYLPDGMNDKVYIRVRVSEDYYGDGKLSNWSAWQRITLYNEKK